MRNNLVIACHSFHQDFLLFPKSTLGSLRLFVWGLRHFDYFVSPSCVHTFRQKIQKKSQRSSLKEDTSVAPSCSRQQLTFSIAQSNFLEIEVDQCLLVPCEEKIYTSQLELIIHSNKLCFKFFDNPLQNTRNQIEDISVTVWSTNKLEYNLPTSA